MNAVRTCVWVVVLIACGAPLSAAAGKPNILFIISDKFFVGGNTNNI